MEYVHVMSLYLAGIYLEIFRKWEDLQCVYVCVCAMCYGTIRVCVLYMYVCECDVPCAKVYVCMCACVCVCAHVAYTVEPPL